MSPPLTFRSLASCIVAAAAAIGFLAGPRPASPADDPAPSRAIYHLDPIHLWNRLHEALFVRVGTDGRTYGHDRIEPLLWPQSNYFLTGTEHNRAAALLSDFVEKQGEKLID